MVETQRRFGLRQFNHLLTLAVILVALYIFALPLLPVVQLRFAKATDKRHGYAYQNNVQPAAIAKTAPAIPADNRLVIPALELNQPIKEGRFINVLNDGGTWRRPKTSDPSKGGNTVIIGHSYTYKGLSTFYNLDKLRVNDIILVYWQGKEHDYQVRETKILPPSSGEIEAPTTDTRLTLYTCTPVWNAKNRLVVIAEPLGGYQ
ncbi:MAG: putative sortase family protein [Candidatus Saccharibacteria bacterium]|nr:putative sortase family protein [Candidatus Saccharibacteria bacterium]